MDQPRSTGSRELVVADGRRAAYPVFLPVHYRDSMVTLESLARAPGMIANAYFFYKEREIRTRVPHELTLRDLVPHPGILMTDSGAFQGFRRPLHLKNSSIVRFQAQLGADIVSPLDLVTSPWESRAVAERKLASTQRRVIEALRLVEDRVVAGVQQGGRFLDLRERATEDLLEAGATYIALGSLVPFLTRNHNLQKVVAVIRQTRKQVGPDMPLHLYGAGDPVELPLFVLAGANVFDSSSYAHFAIAGAYMTSYGAVPLGDVRALPTRCGCAACAPADWDAAVPMDARALSEHNLGVILDTIDAIRAATAEGRLRDMVAEVVAGHHVLFPNSGLEASAASV